MLLTSSSAIFLFFISLSTFPYTPKSTETITVQLKYSRQPVRTTEGQPLTLRCTAVYKKELCENIFMNWCFVVSENVQNRLTDPDRYLNQVNETIVDDGFRHRDASLTFTRLALRDSGIYQCKAICQPFGATAMGHLINVTVTDQKETDDI
ncbi:hypothetical protein KOW79_002749 [Hemibagrus wyckioides]|uniref:Ig-like domain-containing protein n=1 Tax=Hemibagrus wyckioides TaxID=337641 RepID=A0A9D3SRV5_9TELE|nr:hypothetical protein KOW79_002749 [Hemibagrus wyckioides]